MRQSISAIACIYGLASTLVVAFLNGFDAQTLLAEGAFLLPVLMLFSLELPGFHPQRCKIHSGCASSAVPRVSLSCLARNNMLRVPRERYLYYLTPVGDPGWIALGGGLCLSAWAEGSHPYVVRKLQPYTYTWNQLGLRCGTSLLVALLRTSRSP